MGLTGRLFGRYQCLNRHSWKSIDASDTYRICNKCGEEAKRIESRPLEYSDIPENKRLFGKFCCTKCPFQEWVSGNSWKGYTQQCKSCYTHVLPYYLNTLKYQEDMTRDHDKPHRQDLCAKCEELGYNCRDDIDDMIGGMNKLQLH